MSIEALAAGMNEEIKRQNIVLDAYVRRIAELEAALRDIASDDLYLRHMSDWHDVGKLSSGVQKIARKALSA